MPDTCNIFAGKPVMIVTEYMENGSLDSFLRVSATENYTAQDWLLFWIRYEFAATTLIHHQLLLLGISLFPFGFTVMCSESQVGICFVCLQ